MLKSAMSYLSAADATAMAAETQAQCLQALEQVNSMGTAVRASILARSPPPRGIRGRGLQSAGVADPQDRDHQRRRGRAHRVGPGPRRIRRSRRPWPRGDIGVGRRTVCAWTDKLPEDCREAADTILVTAAKAGMDLRDLAELAGEIYARSCPQDSQQR